MHEDRIDLKQTTSRVRKGGIWAIAGKCGSVTMGFAVNALLARMLSPEDMGLYFLALSVVTAGAVFGQLGLDIVAIRYVSKAMAENDSGLCKKNILTLLTLSLSASLTVALIFNFFAGHFLLGSILGSDVLYQSIFWLSVWIVVVVVETMISNIFRGFHDIRLAVCFSGFLRSTVLALIFAASWFRFSDFNIDLHNVLIISVIGGGSSALFGMLLLNLKIGSYPTGKQKVSGELLRASLPIFVHALLLYVVNQSNLWILGVFGTKEEVALYGSAMRLVLLVGVSTSIVNAVVPPLISEKHAQGKLKSIEPLLRAATTICGLPAVMVLVVYISFASQVLSVVYGAFYTTASLILVILSVGELFKALTGPCSIALNMTGHQLILMKVSIIRAIACILLCLLIVDDYGLTGVAIVYACCHVANDLTTFLLAKKKLGIWTHAGFKQIPQLLAR